MSTPEDVILLILTGFEGSKLLLSWKTIPIDRIASVVIQSALFSVMVRTFKAIDLCHVATWLSHMASLSYSDGYGEPLSNWSPITAPLLWTEINAARWRSKQLQKKISYGLGCFIIPLCILLLKSGSIITGSRQQTTAQLVGGASGGLNVFQGSIL